jgi:hypothetical protein
MALVAFGRTIFDPERSAYLDVMLVLRDLPRRFRGCAAEIAMRGSSSDYEDWVAVKVAGDRDDLESACAEWIVKQATRRGLVIVPLDATGSVPSKKRV